MMTEKEYQAKIGIVHRKKYAQFFTPEPIAHFMAQWVMSGNNGHTTILEPAFGLGAFSRAIHRINSDAAITGYDIDETIYHYAQENFSTSNCHLHLKNEDYLETSWKELYDGIICNPPYLKFHDYDNGKYIPVVNKKLHTKLNGFTNIYTLFLLKSISQMKDGGRLAYIIPSEFLNADYGVEVKRALLASGTLRHIIIVDYTQCAFDNALTTACILFCQKGNASDLIRFSKIDDMENLHSALTEYKTIQTTLLNPEVKWKNFYEEQQAYKYHDLVPFSTFAKVSRGIATGANNYFTFNMGKKDKYNLDDNCFKPCISHSADVQSPIFTRSDFNNLADAGKNVFLFNGCADEASPHVKNYIRLGEENGINKRYLTASRSPWYILERREPSPIWVSVFNREGLRFVRNEAQVYNLTTFHCVYNISEIDTNVLFAYLITDMAKEIFLDNSRQYGNGLVKFEPNDLNKGKVVDFRLLSEEERLFICQTYENMHFHGSVSNDCTNLLDNFFRAKYTNGDVPLFQYWVALHSIKKERTTHKSLKVKPIRIKQLNFLDLIDRYADAPIVHNSILHEDNIEYNTINHTKNVLISLVKNDNIAQYLDQSAKVYYTGKRFPSTIMLNKLYYFMPYMKNKGIRDLYLIKIVRVGTKTEIHPECDDKDFRLVFEIEFVKQMFDDYKMVDLQIWHAFTDTTIKKVIEFGKGKSESSKE